jgi:YHS domain-containing protein
MSQVNEGIGQVLWDEASGEVEIDPVCGMEVQRDRAAGSTLYDGTRYYFCSEDCKLTFDGNPEQFVVGARPEAP